MRDQILAVVVLASFASVAGAQQAESEGGDIEIVQLEIAMTGPRELSFSWPGQGTLVCEGQVLNSTVRVPDDVDFDSASECWAELPNGRSTTLSVICSEAKCTATGSGREFNFPLAARSPAPTSSDASGRRAPIFELVTVESRVETSASEQPDSPIAATAFVPGEGRHALQLIALASKERATEFAEQAGIADWSLAIVESNGVLYHAVIAGVYASRAEAQAASARFPDAWIRPMDDLEAAVSRATADQ